MPKIVIKYNSPKTLKALKGLAKYFDFVILSSKPDKTKEKEMATQGVTIIPGDSSMDISGLTKIFTGKEFNAKELRAKAWQRASL